MSDKCLSGSGLAEAMPMKYRERELHLVTFALGEEYAVPVSQVQEIVRVGGITMVPNSPSCAASTFIWQLTPLTVERRM